MVRKSIFIVALLLVSQAQAYHYGMAGCGLGSLVFKDEPGKVQIFAATLNDIVSPQTSAITSGTSGCYDTKSASAKIDYIERNLTSLKEDTARGQGETLEGLLTLLGCRAEADVSIELKKDYSNIFQQENAGRIFDAIKSNETVQKSCNTLG